MRSSTMWSLSLAAGLFIATGCAPAVTTTDSPRPGASTGVPSPDPRIGLRAGMMDAGEAVWNLELLSKTQPPREFIGVTNSDLSFTGNYAIQGNYNGFQVWDITNPRTPVLAKGFVCPASQSDVSVYRNLLFVSGEGMGGRIDCGTAGVPEPVSADRLRGIRIFDITDVRNPKYIGNVQTCRGSHTHTVLESPTDRQNVYIYVSGSSTIRPAAELPGCVSGALAENPNTAEFRIEVIRVPLANPAAAAIVSSPRIFQDLKAPPTHGLAPADKAALDSARAKGKFIIEVMGEHMVLPDEQANAILAQMVAQRGGTTPTAADSATLRERLPAMVAQMIGDQSASGPTQCHDITVYPAIGLAGGACEGYGLLIDIADPVNPRRVAAVADSNFAYWHSATFNNDGTKILFSDEWGGGGGAKCRETDPKAWGADAIFSIQNRRDLTFQSYYKLPVAQTTLENCVAHNGNMIPIPGRDIMVQSWYQGGISIFEFTDPKNPREIAFFDRGPSDATKMGSGGSWSAYWYNGAIYSSEIARGLDVLDLRPSAFISQNEIDAAKSVRLDYLNPQGQPQYVWPATFSLVRAYVDQLERGNGIGANRIAAIREAVTGAENATGVARQGALTAVAAQLEGEAAGARDGAKVRELVAALRRLATR